MQTIGAGAYAVADFNGDGLKDVFLSDFGMDGPTWPGAQNIMLIQKPDGTLANETAGRRPPSASIAQLVPTPAITTTTGTSTSW